MHDGPRSWWLTPGLALLVVVGGLAASTVSEGEVATGAAPVVVDPGVAEAAGDPCFRYGRFECCLRPDEGDAVGAVGGLSEGPPDGPPLPGSKATENLDVGWAPVPPRPSRPSSAAREETPIIRATGPLDRAELLPGPPTAKTVIRLHSHQASACWFDTLAQQPDHPGGRLEIAWRIADGQARDFEVRSDTTGDPEIGRCIVRKIAHWPFAPGTDARVVQPFVFTPE